MAYQPQALRLQSGGAGFKAQLRQAVRLVDQKEVPAKAEGPGRGGEEIRGRAGILLPGDGGAAVPGPAGKIGGIRYTDPEAVRRHGPQIRAYTA